MYNWDTSISKKLGEILSKRTQIRAADMPVELRNAELVALAEEERAIYELDGKTSILVARLGHGDSAQSLWLSQQEGEYFFNWYQFPEESPQRIKVPETGIQNIKSLIKSGARAQNIASLLKISL